METKLTGLRISSWVQPAGGQARHSSPVVAVLTRPSSSENIGAADKRNNNRSIAAVTTTPPPAEYHDSWLEEAAINYLSRHVQEATGAWNEKKGYESLVQATRDVTRKFEVRQQRHLVVQALANAIPAPILHLVGLLQHSNIRTVLPNSKFKREYFAAFTTVFFAWLVGPCEVRESEFNGSKEKNVVHIKKCRFLEQSNCVGMCTNLCKVPSQTFINGSFGMPVNMVPNFDDMSCEMIFGQEPPELSEDPAFKQPCYKLCKINRSHKDNCTS
ncbi:unnamed protein product [Linum tenue]|uniref:Beta-carotene isomerase D27-like C-terminal domain-containing protein n=1 Tax=Linum tenue TaxID=586396 RepID=A0AAV0MR12_9ROSI|nr:unnamed protein product [Linum tenue]